MITQTRLKAGAGLAVMGFVLAVLKHFMTGIPTVEAFLFLGGLYGTYVTGKTSNNNKEILNAAEPK
jgi:hypothetical protein